MFHTYYVVSVLLNVGYVCNGFQAFFMYFLSVSEACFKCFICTQTYVTAVASGCFKSRSGVCICCNVTRLLQLLEGARRVRWGADATWGWPGAQTPRGVGLGVDAASGARGAKCRRERPDVQAPALR